MTVRSLLCLPLVAVVLGSCLNTPATAAGTLGGCPVYPADHAWNQDVSSLPVDPRSDAYVESIGRGGNLHPDFGGNGEYGIPFKVVPRTQKRVRIKVDAYPDESDKGPAPIPLNAPVEGNGAEGDRHVIVLQKSTCKLFELFNARRTGRGWTADQLSRFDLRTGAPRPEGWTSADAAGLAILPGLVRYDEVARGAIEHAVRFTVSKSQKAYIAPASHYASDDTDPNRPPMGLRLRMKAGYDISSLRGQARVIAEALKRYGMIVADNGSDWFITGAQDKRWDDEDLGQLKEVPGSAFEVVQTGAVTRP